LNDFELLYAFIYFMKKYWIGTSGSSCGYFG